mmetsp:Transcript_1660/g.2449  ORF Transcript_1660/g.2449 Transcript_1660/m.2449 type:complete len:247 (-) Transcript_1660:747-1487(-)
MASSIRIISLLNLLLFRRNSFSYPSRTWIIGQVSLLYFIELGSFDKNSSSRVSIIFVLIFFVSIHRFFVFLLMFSNICIFNITCLLSVIVINIVLCHLIGSSYSSYTPFVCLTTKSCIGLFLALAISVIRWTRRSICQIYFFLLFCRICILFVKVSFADLYISFVRVIVLVLITFCFFLFLFSVIEIHRSLFIVHNIIVRILLLSSVFIFAIFDSSKSISISFLLLFHDSIDFFFFRFNDIGFVII